MSIEGYLLMAAVVCGLWAVVSAVLLTVDLDRRGIKTPFPFIGALLFRNLGLYKKTTLEERGKVGPLYFSYVIPINLALALVICALFF